VDDEQRRLGAVGLYREQRVPDGIVGECKRKRGDRSAVGQQRHRPVDATAALEFDEQPRGSDRVASELEEVVVDPDFLDAEDIAPDRHQRALERGACWALSRGAAGIRAAQLGHPRAVDLSSRQLGHRVDDGDVVGIM